MIVQLIFAVFTTSIVSGTIGMGGGMILMGLLSLMAPVTTAMLIHGVTQAGSNGFRAYLHHNHIKWRVLTPYLIGAGVAFALLSTLSIIPSKCFILMAMGGFPILAIGLPRLISVNIEKKYYSFLSGFVVSLAQIMAGASGPILDIFFIKSKLNRFEIIATKAMTQTIGHGLKLVYYGNLAFLAQHSPLQISLWIYPACVLTAFLGNYLGKRRLRQLSELQFQKISRWVIPAIGFFYIIKGLHQ